MVMASTYQYTPHNSTKSPAKYVNPVVRFQGVVWGKNEGVDERRLIKRRTLAQYQSPLEFLGGAGFVNAVNESGMYKLIMRSEKKTAKPFQDWVTKEVLPSIRKTGGYLLNEAARTTAHADTKEAMPDTPAFLSSRRKRPLLLTFGEGTIFRST